MALERSSLRALAVVCLGLTLTLGMLKLWWQRDHSPAWARVPIHQYEGFVAIDGFAQRAEKMRDWLLGRDAGGEQLLAFLRADLHPDALLWPFVIGAVAAGIGSVVTAYVIVVTVALLFAAWLVMRLTRLLLGEAEDDAGGGQLTGTVGWLVLILFSAHCLTVRTAMQLNLDWTCAAMAAATVWLALKFQERSSPSGLLALQLALIAGIFTKGSYLPMCAAPAVVAWWAGERRPMRLLLQLLQALPALVLLFLWSSALGGIGTLGTDVRHLVATTRLSWQGIARFGLEMLLLVQVLPRFVPAGLRIGRWRAGACLTLALLQLAATMAFNLPTLPRIYLPVLCLLLPVAAVGLASLPRERRPRWLWAFAVGNYLMAAGGLFLGG